MVERIQAKASPPPAGEHESCGEDGCAATPLPERHGAQHERDEANQDGRPANGQRPGQSDAQARCEQVRRGYPRHELHRSTRSRSSASVAGPMPDTASSSSTEPKAPWASR